MMMALVSVVFASWSLLQIQQAVARVDGEPWPDACETLSPGKDVPPPQTGPCPFSIILSDLETHNDYCIYVTIKGEEPNEFAGFMIQARNESNAVIGTFKDADDLKLYECFGKPDNTAININYLPKEEVRMRWFPDARYVGYVTFYATIAQDYLEQVYWLKEKSKRVKVMKAKYELFD